jgi:predicted nucleic acid-binding protein
MRILSLDSTLVWTAVEVAADLQLRAGDTIYIAVARRLNIPLVSWDKEQLQKPGNLVTTRTPSDYSF